MATRLSAAEIPAATDSGLPSAQKCMKKRRGCSSSMWLCSAVMSILFSSSAEITGFTSSAVRTKSPVVDTHKFLTNVEPKELALGAGESGTVQVDLTVPAATASGVGDDLVIVAASTAGPPTSNYSVVHLSVSASVQNPR
jgi:hypothetical protein